MPFLTTDEDASDPCPGPSLQIRPLLDGKGLCNSIFEISSPTAGTLILKLYSTLARRRRQASGQDVCIDLRASSMGLGPKLLASSPNGILMEKLHGHCLTEEDIHSPMSSSAGKLLLVAQALGTFHSQPMQISTTDIHMLWDSLHVLLQQIPSESTRSTYEECVKAQKGILETLPLPRVLGHGDFKPSNIFCTSDSTVRLIDFETAGCHYRGYDLAKLFRTRHPSESTKANQRYFLEQYLDFTTATLHSDVKGRCETSANAKVCSIESLQLEMNLLLPMTWLEAAVFFEAMIRDEESEENKLKWKRLATDRMCQYQRALSSFSDLVERYRHE